MVLNWILLDFTWFNRFLIGVIGTELDFTGFYWVLLGFTEFYRVLPGFTGFYRVLPGFKTNGQGVPFNLLLAAEVGDGGQVAHDDLGGFGLAAARLAADDDARVLAVALHRLVGGVADGEDVRRPLEDLAALVLRDVLAAVNVQRPVRVDRHAHLADVRVELARIESAQAQKKANESVICYQ